MSTVYDIHFLHKYQKTPIKIIKNVYYAKFYAKSEYLMHKIRTREARQIYPYRCSDFYTVVKLNDTL